MSAIEKVKLGLDEVRMLTLGAQVLVGFQLRAAFEPRFAHLDDGAKAAHVAALLLLLATLALLIAPGLQHMHVDRLQATVRIERLLTACLNLALAPLALALGVDVAIAAHVDLGFAGALAGTAVCAGAVAAWFFWPLAARRTMGKRERLMAAAQRSEKTPVDDQLNHLLTEARTILPGAQALLGFQLTVVLTNVFAELGRDMQMVHVVALLLVAGAIVLLMTPAAFHRIVYRGEESERLVRTSSRLITLAMAPLGAALALDAYVVCLLALGSQRAALGIGLVVFAGLACAWLGWPLLARHARMKRRRDSAPEAR